MVYALPSVRHGTADRSMFLTENSTGTVDTGLDVDPVATERRPAVPAAGPATRTNAAVIAPIAVNHRLHDTPAIIHPSS